LEIQFKEEKTSTELKTGSTLSEKPKGISN